MDMHEGVNYTKSNSVGQSLYITLTAKLDLWPRK